MAIDKIRLKSLIPVKDEFWYEVDNILDDPPYKVFRRPSLDQGKPDYITVKSEELGREFFLQANYRLQEEKLGNFIELNPNKTGIKGMYEILDKIFKGFNPRLFKLCRIDLCVDLDVPLEYVYNSLRVRYKRKTSFYRAKPRYEILYQDRKLTGFYVGKSPSQLRVYDKKAELKKNGKKLMTCLKI